MKGTALSLERYGWHCLWKVSTVSEGDGGYGTVPVKDGTVSEGHGSVLGHGTVFGRLALSLKGMKGMVLSP
jgi:hypothetical protein